ncbi:MAG: hypothetical protein CVV24_14045, partial [Ignavibacteriae bacterium HGW-Ignavibacteriae-3]
MYTALLVILLAISVLLFISGARKQKRIIQVSGIVLAILTFSFFWFMDFWGEALWYQQLGYGDPFWTYINSAGLLAIGGALSGFVLIYLLTLGIPKKNRIIRALTKILGILIGGVWGSTNWDTILKYWHGVTTGLTDPVLGKDVGFYLFSLPFFDALISLFFVLSVISLIAIFLSSFVKFTENNVLFYIPNEFEITSKKFYFPLYLNASVFILILAAERFLSRYHLMYSSTGVASGMSWTDVNILLPATAVVIVLFILISISLVVPPLRRAYQKYIFGKFRISPDRSHLMVIASAGILIAALWGIAFSALPNAFNWLVVKPNEITYERPYIKNNIEFTRYGFGLDKVEEKEYPMEGTLTQATINENPGLFYNIRLGDWKALDAVYRQFQTMRLYYEFSDVDVDRYTIDGKEKQVMVSGREINLDNLPVQSQTFVNKRFQYTHGYGLTMAGVSEFNAEGLPHLLIKDIPPVTESKSLQVTQPQIYFGELTKTHVIVNSKVKEFDYPSGEDNVYTKYAGTGGVQLSNFWRKFLYGWKFDGTNFLFSDYPTDSSRFMFHRQITERVKLLAPFLQFDKDPYLVLTEGKLVWMIDAYTTSSYYPYSQPFSATENIQIEEGGSKKMLTTKVSPYLEGINYIRNSVKAVINAYDGNVDFYIMDQDDPVIKVWSRIFPGLFKAKSDMSKDLLNHLRYPIDMLLTQGLVY